MRTISVLLGISFQLFLLPSLCSAQTSDVLIKGIDDGVNSSKQQDYREALMNAKIEAIERAGIEIKSITRVVNFQTKYDLVESKANAVLLPGFQVMDMGYQKDGTYQVVLSGKVKLKDKDRDTVIFEINNARLSLEEKEETKIKETIFFRDSKGLRHSLGVFVNPTVWIGPSDVGSCEPPCVPAIYVRLLLDGRKNVVNRSITLDKCENYKNQTKEEINGLWYLEINVQTDIGYLIYSLTYSNCRSYPGGFMGYVEFVLNNFKIQYKAI